MLHRKVSASSSSMKQTNHRKVYVPNQMSDDLNIEVESQARHTDSAYHGQNRADIDIRDSVSKDSDIQSDNTSELVRELIESVAKEQAIEDLK